MFRTLSIWVLLPVFAIGCATLKAPTRERCAGLVAEAAERIDSGRASYREIGEKSVGETGFFYIISPKGEIVYHPNQPLIGRNVSDVPQIRAILGLDRGENTDSLGGLVRTVFFRRLASGDTLCLTIADEELGNR